MHVFAAALAGTMLCFLANLLHVCDGEGRGVNWGMPSFHVCSPTASMCVRVSLSCTLAAGRRADVPPSPPIMCTGACRLQQLYGTRSDNDKLMSKLNISETLDECCCRACAYGERSMAPAGYIATTDGLCGRNVDEILSPWLGIRLRGSLRQWL
jgi:hypothetical protein